MRLNIDWLGQVVEATSGQRRDVYCREHIFIPPKMKDTDFDLP